MVDEKIRAALAMAAHDLNEVSTVQDTLDAIVEAAQRSIPGADHVGLSRAYPDGTLTTLAATDDRVREYDALQREMREGPCVFAIRAETLAHVPDALREERWPAYIPAATRLGLRSQIGVHVFSDAESLGGLNIYSEQVDALDQSSVDAADLFASYASLAMGKAHTYDQMQDGMKSRQRIGIATGLVMQRYDMSEERAFAFLIRASSHGNVKLRDVAAEIVEEHERERAARDA